MELAHGAATDIAMLRTDIDEERALLIREIAATRLALKCALERSIVARAVEGRWGFILLPQEPGDIPPGVISIVQQVCNELSLGAEHAG